MRRVLLGAVVALALAGAAEAADAPPWKTIRALGALEDRIAAGDTLAQAARGKAIGRLGAAFAAMPTETWRDLRNARALVSFLLCGGDAVAIGGAIPPAAVNVEAEALYRGALGYAQGDDEGARALLLPVAARNLPPGLAGRLALVQATLLEATDKPRALGLLDLARLLEPGSLVEEAALRKEMAIAGGSGDFDKLGLLERRYQAGFARSAYAANFRDLVARYALTAAESNDAAGNEHVARLLAPLGRDERRRILLGMARTSVLAGRETTAAFAAQQALDIADKGGRDEARGQIYFGAAALVGPGYDKAVGALAAPSLERLDGRDRDLRLAALEIAAAMRSETLRGPEGRPPEAGATTARGQAALADAETALRSAKP